MRNLTGGMIGKGRTVAEIVDEVFRQEEMKRDFVVNTGLLGMRHSPDEGYFLDMQDQQTKESFFIKSLAHSQLGEKCGIPARYYNVLQARAPELLVRNVNHWLQEDPKDRMVRTLGGQARAFLSNRYRILDNLDLLQAILPAIKEVPDLKVVSCEITDARLYLKAVTPRIQAEVSQGDVVQAGIVISNSEVGLGAFSVEPLVLRLVCMNGMIANDSGIRKYHTGRRFEAEEAIAELLSDETREARDEAFWLTARDIVKGALDEVTFKGIVNRMAEAKDWKITGSPVSTIQEVSKRFRITEDEKDIVLQNLLADAELTAYGVSNAFTKTANVIDSYDRSTEFQRMGHNVLTLSKSEWDSLQV